jgi:sucrose-6-phosphate hydrolase SacC (GH32 family)
MFNWWSTDSVIMPAKEEHECYSGSETLDKHEPRNILPCHVERGDQSSYMTDF